MPYYKIMCLLLEHRIGIRDGNQVIITKSFHKGEVGKVGVACPTEFSNDKCN
jgi:hypothetical protein